MKSAVATLPSGEGRKVRGPVARFTTATVSTMAMSRLITRMVSQSGTRLGSPRFGRVSTTNVVTSSSLSAAGSSQAPSEVRWLARRAIRPSSASVAPATTKRVSAQPKRP